MDKGHITDYVNFEKGKLKLIMEKSKTGAVWLTLDDKDNNESFEQLLLSKEALSDYADAFDIASKALRVWSGK